MGVIKLILYGTVIVIVIVIILSFFISEETVVDPPLSNAPYELVGKPLPKGDRILGIVVNIAQNDDYEKTFNLAKSAGMESVSLSINWNDIEKNPEKYELEPNWLEIANVFYPDKNVKVALIIRPVDTPGRQIPKDLNELKLDDPKVIERFNKLMDYVFSQIPNLELDYLAIGNEIDIAFGNNLDDYRSFENFFKTAKSYIKSKHPDVKIGTTATLYGLTKKYKGNLQGVNEHSDIIIVTYYPLNDNFTVKNPNIIKDEIRELVALYPAKPIYFAEIGYPSSTFLESSEAKQSEFIRETFKTWDKHAKEITYMSFSWLTDSSPDDLKAFSSYYGLSSKGFTEYLRTLGLRTYNGQNKEAFRAIKAEAKARGW